jgi:hypothetical protein
MSKQSLTARVSISSNGPSRSHCQEGYPAVPVLNELLLPDSMRAWVVDIADRAQAPLDFPAAGAITVLSSIIGRRLGIRPKRYDDWVVVPNLWGLVIGPPGLLKTPMLREILKPLMRLVAQAREENKTARLEYELQEAAFQAERRALTTRASHSKDSIDRDELIARLRDLRADPPSERRYIVNDSTVEKLGEILNQNPHGVLLFRDELAGFLATMERSGHENDRAFYLEAWNGTGGYTYDRIARGTLHIDAACVSILGAITPGPLSAYLREAFGGSHDDGLIQRFQLSVYPDLPCHWHKVDRLPDPTAMPNKRHPQSSNVWQRFGVLRMPPIRNGLKSRCCTSTKTPRIFSTAGMPISNAGCAIRTSIR